MFSGMVPSPVFQSRFFVLANENRTQDAGHAFSMSEPESESAQEFGRYQSHHEVPFLRFVPEQPHRNHAAYGPAQQ